MRSGRFLMMVPFLAIAAGLLTLAGCGAQDNGAICNELVNCPGLSLSQAEKNNILQVCPAGLLAVQMASPSCYACVAENTCNTPDACQQACGDMINQFLPGTVP